MVDGGSELPGDGGTTGPASPAVRGSEPLSVAASSPMDSIRFSTGIPPVTALVGSIRLFREKAGLSLDDVSHISSPLLCVVAVPLRMSPSELCLFMGPHLDYVTAMHVLRDVRASTGSYMALIHFAGSESADAFFSAYNGRLFASFDNQVIHCACTHAAV